MRSRASTVIISVMAVSIAVLLWAVVYFARDEWHLKAQTRDDDLPVKSQVGTEDGFATVHVSEQGQRASGIVVQELEASTARRLERLPHNHNPEPRPRGRTAPRPPRRIACLRASLRRRWF